MGANQGYTLTPTPTYGLSTARPLSATPGAFYYETDTKKTYQWNGTQWTFHSIVPDASWITPTLLNSWVNYNTAYVGAGYRKLSDGLVVMHGIVKSGTAGSVIFNLPAGYRPSQAIIVDTQSVDVGARFDILATGDVVATRVNNAWVSIDYSFFPDQ